MASIGEMSIVDGIAMHAGVFVRLGTAEEGRSAIELLTVNQPYARSLFI